MDGGLRDGERGAGGAAGWPGSPQAGPGRQAGANLPPPPLPSPSLVPAEPEPRGPNHISVSRFQAPGAFIGLLSFRSGFFFHSVSAA